MKMPVALFLCGILFCAILFGSCGKTSELETISTGSGYKITLQFELEDYSPGDVVVVRNGDTEHVYTEILKGINTVELISKTSNGILTLKARNADQTEVTLETISY